MLPFELYFESFDTVQDFLSNPIHNDKEKHEWIQSFVDSGGQVLGTGKYGTVYYHPKWPYVVKTFTTDDPYVKFMRWAAKNPHSAFPKAYGSPRLVVPPYKRRADKADKFYAVRLEKLKPISEKAYQMFDGNKMALARYFYMMDNPEEFERMYLPESREYYVQEMKRKIDDLPPEIVTACYGYYLLNRGNDSGGWGDEDLHRGNVMQREDNSIVLADPVWYGYNPYAAARENERMEMDYYGYDHEDDTPEPKMVRGGKLPKHRKVKKPKPDPVPERTPVVPDDDDIPF